MSNLRCPCGHLVSDSGDHLPYKASLLLDVYQDGFFDAIAKGAIAFAAAVARGDRERWMREHGFRDGYPRDVDDEGLFSDFVSWMWLTRTRTAYECASCGRLLLQARGTENEFVTYAPEEGPGQRILGALDAAPHPLPPFAK